MYRKIMVLGLLFLLTACSSDAMELPGHHNDMPKGSENVDGGNGDVKLDTPPPPHVRMVREKTEKVKLDEIIHCWNGEPCTEEYRILNPEESSMTRVKPNSDIRISFPTGQEPDEVIFIQREPTFFSVRTVNQVDVLEPSGPSEPGMYFYEIDTLWSGKNGGRIIYSFRLNVVE